MPSWENHSSASSEYDPSLFVPENHTKKYVTTISTVNYCLCPGGFSVQGVSVQRGDRDPPRTVTSGRYASYWNAFLLWQRFHCFHVSQIERLWHLIDTNKTFFSGHKTKTKLDNSMSCHNTAFQTAILRRVACFNPLYPFGFFTLSLRYR